MFGKGTFKSSGNFRPNVSAVAERKSFDEQIKLFNDAENSGKFNDPIKAVQLYNKFLNDIDNTDEGNIFLVHVFMINWF